MSPEFVLDTTQEDFEKSTSKFITFDPSASPGTLYFKPVEMGMPDWDTAGVSLKFPVTVTEKGDDEGKEDKISAGVAANAVWKLKDILKALGVPVEMKKGADGKTHPAFKSDDVAGKKAVGCWELIVGAKGGDPSKGTVKYPKLTSIYPEGYEPEVKELV